MTRQCCGCASDCTPSPRDVVFRSDGERHTRSGSDVGLSSDKGQTRPQSRFWFDEVLGETSHSVQTIHEEWSNRETSTDMTDGRNASIDRALRLLQSTRRAMEDGIEEMQCQIYQIKFCNTKFKQKRPMRHRLLDTISATSFGPGFHDHRRSECIATAKDTFYESSRSGTEHGADDSGSVHRHVGCASDETEFASPIPTPNPSERSESAGIHRFSTNNGRNNDEVDACPRSPSTSHGIGNRVPSTSEREPDAPESEKNAEMEMTASPRVRCYSTKGFETDATVNLHSHCESTPKKEQSKKGSGLNKLVDMLAKARRGRRQMQSMPYTQSASPRLQSNRKAKGQRRWARRISGMQRIGMASPSRKFTDKYPIDASRWGRMQCFSPVYKGSQVILHEEGTVAASRGDETSFVLCAEEVTHGVMQFDLDCLYLSDWCFLGVVSKKAVMKNDGPISESEMSYGWSNRKQLFNNGVSKLTSNAHRFSTGTSLQIIINAEAGTLHCRFPSDQKLNASKLEAVGNEILTLPKKTAWTLAVEWKGAGRFELAGVRSWR